MKKTALVTGANSGIGFATAKLLMEKKYQVYISGRNRQRLDEAAKKLNAVPILADMGDLSAIQAVFTPLFTEGLNILVNNAAIAKFMPLEAVGPEDFSELFNVNVRGPLELIRLLLPALEKCQGSVVNVSSVIADNGAPNSSIYAATKGAIAALTRSLAQEFAPRQIRVNAVAPGLIETPIFSKLGFSTEELAGIKKHYQGIIPMRRYGTPEEVAEVIVAQAEATYVTGAVWSVDGGLDAQ